MLIEGACGRANVIAAIQPAPASIVKRATPPSLGTNLCTTMCTARGRAAKFWGFRKTSGDNPGDSELPLDLVFPVRESISRTGQRTPTGAGKPSHSADTFGWSRNDNGHGPRGGSGLGRSEKPLALGTESPGNRRPRAQGLPGRSLRSTPTAPEGEVRRCHNDGTGNRVSVNDAEKQRGRLAGRPGFDSGNGVRFAGRRRRGDTATGEPAATSERNGVG